jgi:hypothetical protein
MNIFALKGHKVTFVHPNGGWPYDQQLAKTHLVLGNNYTIEKTIVDSYSTDVLLEEVPNIRFNAVIFDDKDSQDEEKDKLHPDYYRYHSKPESVQIQASDVLKVIKTALEKEFGNDFVSPTMYHKERLEKEVSISFMENVPLGFFRRFTITVKDNK